MAVTSNTPTAMTAAVELVVDKRKLQREIAGASNSVSQGLRGLEQGASRQVSQAMTKTVADITGRVKDMSDKISAVLNVPLKFGLSAGGGAIAAFLRSSTSEANQFKARLAEVQTALGGVGQKLAMNVKFGDKSGYEWAKKLAEYLESLDVSQLQKAADIVKNIAFTIAGLKGISLGADLLKSGSQALHVLNALRGTSAAAGAAQGLSALGTAGAVAGGAGGAVLASRAKGILELDFTQWKLDRAKAAFLKEEKAGKLFMESVDKLGLPDYNTLSEKQQDAILEKLLEPGYVDGADDYAEKFAKSNKASRAYGFEAGRQGQSYAWRLGSAFSESGMKGVAATLAKSVGKFALGSAIFLAASKFAEIGIKKGVKSFQREQGWLKKATGQGMFSLGGGDKISTWRAVRENGLYTDNWFDRLFGGKDPHRGMETTYSAEETKAALAENARLRAEQKESTADSGLYRRETALGKYLSKTNIDFAKEDAARTTDLDYETASKRKDTYSYIQKEAEELAEQFKALRDKVTYGTAAYDTYNKSYVASVQEAIRAQQALSDIERLRVSEAKAEAATLKDARERIAELRARQSERSTEGDKRMRAAVASYDKREEDVRKRLDEYTKGRSSISLGVSASQMPQFAAYRVQEAQGQADEYAKAQADAVEALKEIAEARAEVEDTWRLQDRKDLVALSEAVTKIKEAVAGTVPGTPVE